MRTALIYIRAAGLAPSTLAQQHVACEAACARQGLTVVGRYHDIAPGASDPATRPGFALVLAHLQREPTTFVVMTDASRIARPATTLQRGLRAIDATGARALPLAAEVDGPSDEPRGRDRSKQRPR